MKDSVQEVLDYIKTHLTPKELERQLYGEVFTPLPLVDEMLSKLPKHVWHNPDFKWLDPANGMGNFPIKALIGQREGPYTYPGLLQGLASKFPTPLACCEHIVRHMLYMVDVNPANNKVAKHLFKRLCPSVEPNIERIHPTQGFLSTRPLVFQGKKVPSFNIIMGNPPFNRGGVSRPDTRRNKTRTEEVKRETIWNLFVLRSQDLLASRGYLLFIHPIGWFHPGEYDPVREVLLGHQLHIVRTFKHDSQSSKHFSGRGKITTAYYLMENTVNKQPTLLIGTGGQEEHLRLSKDSFILLNHSSIMNKILQTLPLWKSNPDFKHKGVPCQPGKHKQIAGIYEDGTIRVVRTQDKHPDANKSKLIVSGAKYPRVFLDERGEYGLVGSTINYWIGAHIHKLHTFLKTKLAAFLTSELRYRQDFVEFKYFPDITSLPYTSLTDKQLAVVFGFSKEEQEVIQEVENPQREYRFVEVACGNQTRKSKRSLTAL